MSDRRPGGGAGVDLAVDVCGVAMRNPVIAAAGTCGYAGELADVLDLRDLGALTTKSITRESREGNPPWRMVPTESGMLNAIGLANVGLDRFLAEKVIEIERADTVIIGSIAGGSVAEYVAVAEAFDDVRALPIVELNVSCPNTADGRRFGSSAAALGELVSAVRRALAHTKMLVKLSPDAGDIVPLARAAIECGADGLTLINTFPALAIDVETRRSRLSRGAGGLSGPAIHPIAVRMVAEVHEAVAREAGVPIVGLGGVMRWQDAAELILAGATAVGVGTALFVDPRAVRRIVSGLERWVARQGARSITELVGAYAA